MQDLGATSLGPYPILQLTAAILVLLGVGMAVWRGFRDKNQPKEDDGDPPHVRWFFDGPLKRHLEVQEEIAQFSKATRDVAFRTENEKIGEELRKQTSLLERIAGALERRRT
jgi:hypothetical protein